MSGPFSPEARRAFQQDNHSHSDLVLARNGRLTGAVLDATSTLGGVSGTSLASAFGAWTSYTPTLAQGASSNIAKTVNYAKYVAVGKLIIGQVKLTASATGTAGSAITITLPVTAATSDLYVGVGFYWDHGASMYHAIARLASTTTIDLYQTDVLMSSGQAIGVVPNIAVASSDRFHVSFTYEAA